MQCLLLTHQWLAERSHHNSDLTMKNGTSKMCALVLLVLFWVSTSSATESDVQEQSERSGRSWHQSLFGPQMLMQHQQNQPSVSTSQPDGPNQQPNQQPPQTPDLNVPNRNFEEHEKSALPAASEQDFMSRHFGYLNVHRFDPNFPYYDSRNSFPRYPSPHAPRFGPGYRKDKYGHGYGYSCKQGDDCEEVKAANQLAARNPAPAPSPYSPHPFHHNPMTPFGNQFPDLAPFPSMPSFPNMNSFAGAYGNQFGAPPPARFSDPHPQPHHLLLCTNLCYLQDTTMEDTSTTKKTSKRICF
ncbi:hypothetical protein HNY73_000322 [Argiope bruennichi]|uniref:Uncharacterized protein n=1 Tax=Argiope bruennichi TaxID=94029 RepID=A0A8T0FXU6_ARGBR|nr:hypothetical protein HNY73_000322 [Argiope bruennichi]